MSMRKNVLILTLMGLFFIGGCGGAGAGLLVDTVFVNGHLVTMDEGQPMGEAMAVRGGRIVAVGSTAEIEGTYFYPERVDLRGQMVMPEIVESHGHLRALGESFRELNMMEAEAPEEVMEKLCKQLAEMEGAYSGFDEGVKGQLKEGMLADFIVIPADILRRPGEAFGNFEVEERYVGGVLVYNRRMSRWVDE
ncbi:MAG: hypothetical protein GY869_01080 [Planctomycetes bacterium]|nr:hypothetical protein [Planctomycetota bacterium]